MGRPPKQNPAPETVKRNIRRTKKQARETSGSQPSVPNSVGPNCAGKEISNV